VSDCDAEEAFQRIGRQDGRYHERGYLFVLAALEVRPGQAPGAPAPERGELAWACRDFGAGAVGLLAPTVLGHWGIATTEDLGRMVFTLIDVGLLASRRPTSWRTSSGLRFCWKCSGPAIVARSGARIGASDRGKGVPHGRREGVARLQKMSARSPHSVVGLWPRRAPITYKAWVCSNPSAGHIRHR